MAERAKVMVVNDDPDLVEAMRAVLEEVGYDVITSNNRLVAEVEGARPDVLLVDCGPGEEKLIVNFIQGLRLNKATNRIPILLGTTSQRFLEPDLLRAKSIRVVVRPFEIDELLATVADLLAGVERSERAR